MEHEIQTTNKETGIANFEKVEKVIVDLVTGINATEFEVETPKGMRDALAVRQQIRSVRINLGKAGKSVKKQLNDEKKRIDGEVDRLTTLALTGETPLHDLIKAEEDRKAEEKRLRDEAEAERKRKIQATIQGIADLPGKCAHGTADELTGAMEYLEAYDIGLFFAEYTEQAQDTQAASLVTIKGMLDARLARDAEDAERAAEAARLAEQKRVQDERQAVLDAEQAEVDRKNEATEQKAGKDNPLIVMDSAEFKKIEGPIEEEPAYPSAPVQEEKAEWAPLVRRLKKDLLGDILTLAVDAGLSDAEALERIVATCKANLRPSK